jgi:aspartate/tyrosine/aromatic aminotransferase
MFEQIKPAPPDPILGLTEAFKADPHPKKVNLGVGVYKDASGQTPVLASVKAAEEKLLRASTPRTTCPSTASRVRQRYAGAALWRRPSARARRRVVTAQAPGGTGALRVAGDFIASTLGAAHRLAERPDLAEPSQRLPGGRSARRPPTRTSTSRSNSVAFDAMLAALHTIPAGDVVVLHGCCHNPTGVDLDRAQWRAVAAVVAGACAAAGGRFCLPGLCRRAGADAAGLHCAGCSTVPTC